MTNSQPLYDIQVTRVDGSALSMSEYKGKVLLVVNVASQCGFTPQYEGLEKLYEKYKSSGLEILGFPCNQFGGQEPGSESEIASFCKKNYGVSFTIFSKIEVNGSNEHPLYAHLKQQARGFLGLRLIKWNFTKFLVNRDGRVLKRFGSTTKPEALAPRIEEALGL